MTLDLNMMILAGVVLGSFVIGLIFSIVRYSKKGGIDVRQQH